MILDSWLVARLARELDESLAGARIHDVRSQRLGLELACYRRGGPLVLRALLDPNGPVVATLDADAAANEKSAAGWAGGVSPLLRTSLIEAIRAVPNDRVLNVEVSSRSAFGVPSRHRITIELEPRKANALVLRPSDGADQFVILAALKQFKGEGESRSLEIGNEYVPPPPQVPSLDRASFVEAVAATGQQEVRGLARLLGRLDPQCTPPLARDVVERTLQHDLGEPGPARPFAPEALAQRLIEAWRQLRERVAAAAQSPSAELFVYRRGADIAACHLVPLVFAAGEPERVRSLNDACADQIRSLERRRGAPASAAVRKRLATAQERCETEIAALQASRRNAERSDDLRRAGDSIYANLAAIPPRAHHFVAPDGVRVALDPALSAKENAATYFRKYKKIRSGLAQVQKRLGALALNREYYAQLVWELDRADAQPAADRDAVYRDVADALGVRGRSKRPGAVGFSRPSTRNTYPLPGGATALVGRSPKENDRLTFTFAGPDDFWFHARGIPGAHVVVKPAIARGRLREDQIAAAAALAAEHSGAADAGAVDVDYTRRKHVRRRGGGRPGLVWYTDFETIRVQPRES